MPSRKEVFVMIQKFSLRISFLLLRLRYLCRLSACSEAVELQFHCFIPLRKDVPSLNDGFPMKGCLYNSSDKLGKCTA